MDDYRCKKQQAGSNSHNPELEIVGIIQGVRKYLGSQKNGYQPEYDKPAVMKAELDAEKLAYIYALFHIT
ncbi:MAG: hypothetical protein PHV60_10015 [bacterium]|nr:hypothetical protein [bacterium]